jgi:hypothetical protein
MLADVLTLKQELISILRQLANPGYDPSKAIAQNPRKAVLTGHSLGCHTVVARNVHLGPILTTKNAHFARLPRGCDLQQLRCSAGAASDPEQRCVVNALTNGLRRRDTHTCRICSPGLGNESYC